MIAKQTNWTIVVVATILGLLIGWIDSRPSWDDTGVTAAVVFGLSAILGFAMPSRPWIWGLAIGIWTPLLGILLTNNFATIIALCVALLGAYGGSFARRIFISATKTLS